MLKIIEGNRRIDNEIFGGKANGLSLLFENGFTIPKTLYIEACNDERDILDQDFQSSLQQSMRSMFADGYYNVAIRSSATCEDSFDSSLAGHYKTLIGLFSFQEVIAGIIEVVNSFNIAYSGFGKMGVVIQEKIEADFSGVIFTSDPFTYSKHDMIISYSSGLGDNLVSGKSSGNDIIVSIDNNEVIFKNEIPNSVPLLAQVCRDMKALETQLHYPLDIEWVIRGDALYYLQCRPMASITKVLSSCQLVNEAELKNIPAQLKLHEKVTLRLIAQEISIPISDAYLSIYNDSHSQHDSITIERSSNCCGYSAVIVYPQKISNKVIRSFIGDKLLVKKHIIDCCRYGIRSFPKYDDINNCLEAYYQQVSQDYWICATIIQEIFDPQYTGIIQRINDGYLVEITRGHFLTKGVVPTSQYVLSKSSFILSKKEIEQKVWLKIIEGHIVQCVCNENSDPLVSLSDNALSDIIKHFKTLLTSASVLVEFGVLFKEDSTYFPYLIDFVDNKSSNMISLSDINTGVISRGRITGTISYVSQTSFSSLDVHLGDLEVAPTNDESCVIFFCDKPDISLLSIIHKYDKRRIGFVFAEGSVLCHLAVVLREMGIPAIKIGHYLEYEYKAGSICSIDAETPEISGKERIKD